MRVRTSSGSCCASCARLRDTPCRAIVEPKARIPRETLVHISNVGIERVLMWKVHDYESKACAAALSRKFRNIGPSGA